MSGHGGAHDHERTDANVGPAAKIAVVMCLGVIVSFALMVGLFRIFASMAESESAPAAKMATADELPPLPRLEVVPGRNLEQLQAETSERLHGYGWADRTHRTAHIPIEKAIDVVVEQGLPTREPAARSEP
jgi:hypothetical protein